MTGRALTAAEQIRCLFGHPLLADVFSREGARSRDLEGALGELTSYGQVRLRQNPLDGLVRCELIAADGARFCVSAETVLLSVLRCLVDVACHYDAYARRGLLATDLGD
jgi:hypothetical protein